MSPRYRESLYRRRRPGCLTKTGKGSMGINDQVGICNGIGQAVQIVFEVGISIGSISVTVGPIIWIKSMGSFVAVGHTIVVAVCRCRRSSQRGPGIHCLIVG